MPELGIPRSADNLRQQPLAVDLDHLLASLPKHGDVEKWRNVLTQLPAVRASSYSLGDTVTVEGDANPAQLRDALAHLHPWRKGPFSLFGVHIDSEWRSNWKWRRVAPHIDLVGKRVLDVGCGNGYYGWRMLQAGALSVLGIDPTAVYVVQHAAIARYLPGLALEVRPIRLEELPVSEPFDYVFSMGVIYHQRNEKDHLAHLGAQLATGATLVLETLVVDDEYAPFLRPSGRYARMRNVWKIPTRSTLEQWLVEAGFATPRIVDVSTTTTDEQRSTQWMRFESLQEALDPTDSTRTIEGYPAPQRAVIIASHGR